ncbi:MAG: hypothetical protein AAF614_40745 [Chloroflexota bacterium]
MSLRQRCHLSPIALWLLLSAVFLSGVSAQTTQRAGVVVDFGNGRFQTACITFTEPQISGLELLQRADLPLEVDEQAAGALVCGIDGTGCPADDCFCQCRSGTDCQFWNYAHLQNGAWQFSGVGASQYTVINGDVDGWAWGNNGTLPAPNFSLEMICSTERMYLPIMK